ncbi:MAG: hypothetical protein AAFN70_17780 [Planctomycetota bacterium]
MNTTTQHKPFRTSRDAGADLVRVCSEIQWPNFWDTQIERRSAHEIAEELAIWNILGTDNGMRSVVDYFLARIALRKYFGVSNHDLYRSFATMKQSLARQDLESVEKSRLELRCSSGIPGIVRFANQISRRIEKHAGT